MRPRVILLLGATAVAAVLGPDERITRCRGRWFERKGTHIIATYHPSALLRDPSKKRAAWEDLQSLRQRLYRAFALSRPFEGGQAMNAMDRFRRECTAFF